MKKQKLSELADDTLLTIENGSDFRVMRKADFLDSSYYLDYPTEPFPDVCVAEEEVARFDLYTALENWFAPDHHEDWLEDVWREVEHMVPDVEAFETALNSILENNPTYYPGNEVEIDMPKQEEQP